MGPWVDIANMNQSPSPPGAELGKPHAWTGRPVLVTEFSFKALHAGVPSDTSASLALATQEDPAASLERYLDALVRLPFLVGYHWFQHSDQPPTGRFDGESNNFGLVPNQDVPWRPVVDCLTQINFDSEALHRNP
jgi:hypothetical protein